MDRHIYMMDLLIRSQNKKISPSIKKCLSNVLGGIRTHGLPLRRRSLYPTELQEQKGDATICPHHRLHFHHHVRHLRRDYQNHREVQNRFDRVPNRSL